MKHISNSSMVTLLVLVVTLSSCGAAKIRHDAAERDDVKQKTERAVEDAVVTYTPSTALAQEMRNSVLTVIQKTDTILVLQELYIANLPARYDPVPANAAANLIMGMKGRSGKVRADAEALLKQIEELSPYFAPEGIKQRRDALITQEVALFKERTGKRKLSEVERTYVADLVSKRLFKELEDVGRTLLGRNQELKVLLEMEHATLIEVRTMNESMELEIELLDLEMAAYFATGKSALGPVGHQALINDAGTIMVRIGRHIRTVAGDLVSDPLERSIKVMIYIKGYADTQGYSNLPEEQWSAADLALSQDRAETVAIVIHPLIMEHFKANGWYDLKVLEPVISTTGLGHDLPFVGFDPRDIGQSDEARRFVSIQVIIVLE